MGSVLLVFDRFCIFRSHFRFRLKLALQPFHMAFSCCHWVRFMFQDRAAQMQLATLERSETWGSLGTDVGVDMGLAQSQRGGNCNQVLFLIILSSVLTRKIGVIVWLLTMAAVPLLANTGGPLMVAHRCGAGEVPENTLERALVLIITYHHDTVDGRNPAITTWDV